MRTQKHNISAKFRRGIIGFFAAFLVVFGGLATVYVSLNTPAYAVDDCPCTIFGETTPVGYAAGDPTTYELGVRFRSSVDGYVTGVRFYKHESMDGIHQGRLWDQGGEEITSGTFTNETNSGWQQLAFDQPVRIAANQIYTASYSSNNGRYFTKADYFQSDQTSGPLTAPGGGSMSNGVFVHGAGNFPNSSYADSNYWVDVSFTPLISGTAPSVKEVTPINGQTGLSTGSSRLNVQFNQTMNESTFTAQSVTLHSLSGTSIPLSYVYNKNQSRLMMKPLVSLASDTTYQLRVHGGLEGVKNIEGTALNTDFTSNFTTRGVDQGVVRLWELDTGTVQRGGVDEISLTLGTEFTSEDPGIIDSIVFYRSDAAQDTTYTVALWSVATGELLGVGTSTVDNTEGWKTVNLDEPVTIEPNQPYIATTYFDDGSYTFTANGLADALQRTPLRTSANAGRYVYGGSSQQYPDQTSSANYWITPVYSVIPSPVDPIDPINPTEPPAPTNPETPVSPIVSGNTTKSSPTQNDQSIASSRPIVPMAQSVSETTPEIIPPSSTEDDTVTTPNATDDSRDESIVAGDNDSESSPAPLYLAIGLGTLVLGGIIWGVVVALRNGVL